MRTKILLLLGTVLTVALATPSVFADTTQIPVVHNLVLTELSSTDLTATYDGNAIQVLLLSPDDWTVVPPTTVESIDTMGTATVIEPESANIANVISWYAPFPIHVLSDSPTVVPLSEQDPNGTTFTDAGFDTSDGGLVDVTFRDLADFAAPVPEPGSFSLLCTGLLGLALLIGLKG